MTDDFKPISETPPDPQPVNRDGDEVVEYVEIEREDTFINSNGEFVLEEPISIAPVDVLEVYESKPTESVWVRLRQAIFGGISNQGEHFTYLDQAIESAPETASNYVLRGELYLGAREYALARRDFQRACELAAKQFERSDWGLIAQAMQDRALDGLQKAERRLGPDIDQA